MSLAERLGKLPLEIKATDGLTTPAAREAFVEMVLFRLKMAMKREPDLERVLDILESTVTLCENYDKKDAISNETFDKYYLAAVQGVCANSALYHAHAMLAAKNKVLTFGKMAMALAMDAAAAALEMRKQVLNGHNAEGSVQDDQRCDVGSTEEEVRTPDGE